MSFKIQYDAAGRFRIVRSVAGQVETRSPWTGYKSLAILNHKGTLYVASSEYGLLPRADTVYELKPRETELDKSWELTDSANGKKYASCSDYKHLCDLCKEDGHTNCPNDSNCSCCQNTNTLY
jgi:hypothetical protein